MLQGQLTTLLGLLSGAWLPIGSMRTEPQAPPPRFWAVTNQTWALGPLDTWKAFLGLQKTQRLAPRWLQHGQKATKAESLPLDPREVTREMCKAVPFVQVFSRPGCTAARVQNHLCFGRCSSLYVPGSDATPLVLCNSCVPTRKRWAPVVLWCSTGSPDSPRRVKIFSMLIEGCQCRPKA